VTKFDHADRPARTASRAAVKPSADGGLTPLANDDPRLSPPSRITPAPVDPQLPLLPTHEMEWPDFERLLVRVAREVRGLRAVSLFGNPGQAQDGLDVVGINAAGESEGVQGKRYQRFTVADLDAAVGKFVGGTLPFTVHHLAVGASCEAHERTVVERLLQLNASHAPLTIELWDRQRLSELLRDRPHIVIEFFGTATAANFCAPYEVPTIPVPGSDAVSTADAVALGPESSGAAGRALAAADSADPTDPATALAHVQEAQRHLTEAGFPAHAAVLDQRVVALLTRLARKAHAARLMLDRFWQAVADGQSRDAEMAARALADLAGGEVATADEAEPEHASGLAPGNPARAHAEAEHRTALLASKTAAAALGVLQDPLGRAPTWETLPDDAPTARDYARLVLLAAETALADGDTDWLSDRVDDLNQAASAAPGEAVSVRLELVAAEASDDWEGLLHRARTRAIPRELAALVLARHGRYLTLRGEHRAADNAWVEAVEQACLASRNSDAANWLYSRRMLASRYTVLLDDLFHPLARALGSRPTQPLIAGSPSRPRERALEALQRSRHRAAALALRQHLRDAVTGASWQDEHDAHGLLADLHEQTGDLALAADHLVRAGEAKRAHELGTKAGDAYLDVRHHLAALTYWTRAAAFRLVAAQADLVPDEQVAEIADQALAVLDAAAAGTLVDTPMLGPSVYLAATEALAGLGGRLSADRAQRVLGRLAPYARAEAGRGWHTDDAHAEACERIGRTHPALLDQALDQLLELLARASHSLKSGARDLLLDNIDRTEEGLRALAATSVAAAELLAFARPEQVDAAEMEAAAASLSAPLTNGPGVYGVGTDAVSRSVVAARLPAARRTALIGHQIERARSPYEAASDRRSYLIAAANLASDLAEDDIARLLPQALELAQDPPPSEADALMGQFSHPLGGFRYSGDSDSRAAAVFLAARLARTREQRDLVRRSALAFISAGEQESYHATRALQALEDDLEADVPLLASLGWPLRSLAGIVWAASGSLDPEIGNRLAVDTDLRVRRALAGALARSAADGRTARAREILASDPRYSVRRTLGGTDIDD
jgi:hypothetical protein